MAKKDDNTVTWLLLGVGAFFLINKMKKPATTVAPGQSAMIQKTNPVNTTQAANPLSSLITAGGKLLSNLLGNGDAGINPDDVVAAPMPVDTSQNNYTDQPIYSGHDYVAYNDATNTEAVMPDFEFQNISGIPPVAKRTIRRDEND